MSDDTTLFQPPRSYPEPPKDMWYEVPKDKPLVYQRPKAIFPWEANQSRPSRIFPDEPQLPPVPDPNHQPSPMPTLDTSGGADIEASGSTMEAAPETIPTSIASAGGKSEPFASYARTNAWDEVPGIQRYVEALQTRNKKRHSPAGSIGSISQVAKGMHRRPSLILTDFPTEMDRPSLPVTPAPIRRNVFWGGDQSNDEDLPAAEGVPSQSTWDPISRLEELQRRQSEAFLSGPSVSKSLPSREQISSTISSTVQEDTEVSKVSPQSAAVYSPKEASMFLDIDFEHPTTTDVDEIIIPVASLAV